MRILKETNIRIGIFAFPVHLKIVLKQDSSDESCLEIVIDVRRDRLANDSSKKSAGNYFFPKMASLAALATRNFTTRLAGILMAAPV